MKSVIDRFGEDVEITVIDDNHFHANVSVCTSSTFFGWMFSFGGKMEIIAPKDIYISLARCVVKSTEKQGDESRAFICEAEYYGEKK